MPFTVRNKGHECSIAGCTRPAQARLLCRKHYLAWARLEGTKPCDVDGCDAGAVARGLCMKHYVRLRRTGTLDDPVSKTAREIMSHSATAQS